MLRANGGVALVAGTRGAVAGRHRGVHGGRHHRPGRLADPQGSDQRPPGGSARIPRVDRASGRRGRDHGGRLASSRLRRAARLPRLGLVHPPAPQRVLADTAEVAAHRPLRPAAGGGGGHRGGDPDDSAARRTAAGIARRARRLDDPGGVDALCHRARRSLLDRVARPPGGAASAIAFAERRVPGLGGGVAAGPACSLCPAASDVRHRRCGAAGRAAGALRELRAALVAAPHLAWARGARASARDGCAASLFARPQDAGAPRIGMGDAPGGRRSRCDHHRIRRGARRRRPRRRRSERRLVAGRLRRIDARTHQPRAAPPQCHRSGGSNRVRSGHP